MTGLLKLSFTNEVAQMKVQQVQENWNTRSPEIVVQAYSEQSEWRIGDECLSGYEAINEFLARKWLRELHYRLEMELWTYTDNRISIRFECEWQHAMSGQWMRTHGSEQWEFDGNGLVSLRDVSASDIEIKADDRRIGH
ncbi:MAG: nuclear transport factor 2 family protein [Gammaproteobacteria bacterium]|nr:nuclear transport factor 2 family protein [Gammaproteobacteria bacterium]